VEGKDYSTIYGRGSQILVREINSRVSQLVLQRNYETKLIYEHKQNRNSYIFVALIKPVLTSLFSPPASKASHITTINQQAKNH
jgi:hypothetical protein